MSTPNPRPEPSPSRERSREDHLEWNVPYPEHDEMVIEGLTDEEAEAFLAAITDA